MRKNQKKTPKHDKSETFTYCNCAECGMELISRYERGKLQGSQVAGRIRGRPYCCRCLATTVSQGGIAAPMEDMSPGQENAIRELEG